MKAPEGEFFYRYVTPDDVGEAFRYGATVDFDLVNSPLQRVPDDGVVLYDRDWFDITVVGELDYNAMFELGRLMADYKARVSGAMRNAGMNVMTLNGVFENNPYKGGQPKASTWTKVIENGMMAKVRGVDDDVYTKRRDISGEGLVNEAVVPLVNLDEKVVEKWKKPQIVTIADDLTGVNMMREGLDVMSFEEKIAAFIDAIKGLKHMHYQLGLIHGDFKIENIMMFEDGAKLADMEFSFPTRFPRPKYGNTPQYFFMTYLRPRYNMADLPPGMEEKIFKMRYMDHFALAMSLVDAFFGLDAVLHFIPKSKDEKMKPAVFANYLGNELVKSLKSAPSAKVLKLLWIVKEIIIDPACIYTLDEIMEDLEKLT